MFNNLKDLEYLNLDDCFLPKNELRNNTFNHMTKLKELDLSINIYKKIDLTKLKGMKNIESIKFHSCWTKELIGWKNITEIFPKLKTIGIFYNSFNCDELREILEELKRREIDIECLNEYGKKRLLKHCTASKDDKKLVLDNNNQTVMASEPDRLGHRSHWQSHWLAHSNFFQLRFNR